MNVLKLLPNKFKVWALKNLYSDIASKGDEGDTALAHVNSFEVALLRAVGGSGTINAKTGLLEFKGGGGSKAPTETKSVTTVSTVGDFAVNAWPPTTLIPAPFHCRIP